MGANFRNSQEIQEVAGCDKLTIAPKPLDALKAYSDPLEPRLSKETATEARDMDKVSLTEGQFREMPDDDAMATEKLAEGIRGFSADLVKLEGALSDLSGRIPARPVERTHRHRVRHRRHQRHQEFMPVDATTNPSPLSSKPPCYHQPVASGDINATKKFMSVGATTNPEYAGLVNEAAECAKAQKGSGEFELALMIEKALALSPCPASTPTTRSTATTPPSWVPFSATLAKYKLWPAATNLPLRQTYHINQ